MTKIFFIIPGQPVPKGRPRFDKSGHAYTPAKTRAYEALVGTTARKAMSGKKLLTGAIGLTVTAFFQIPKAFTKAQKEQAASGEMLYTKRGDWDNVGKIVSDACNGIVYFDDAQIADAVVRKRYSIVPRVEVTIREI